MGATKQQFYLGAAASHVRRTLAKALVWLGLVVLPLAGWAQSGRLLTAFTNPAATPYGLFGYAVAALDSQRVLIGAHGNTGVDNGGEAYLFSTNGTLLTTFTNPIPRSGGAFGVAVAGVGGDRVLVGTMYADPGGVAYLFNTNGTLLVTFTNPSPATIGRFGVALAVLGEDRVLIGAEGYPLTTPNSGAAFLFKLDGTLLATLNDPIPGQHLFGHALAIACQDKLLVGAPGTDPGQVNPGAAYLFSTNGTVLLTFTNPSALSFDNFGHAVAAVGTDRVLISGAGDSGMGCAYLFNSNGTWLSTFASPAPTVNGQFAGAMAVLDPDRLLLGEPLANEETRIGAAYLLDTNGLPLASINHPFATAYSSQYLEFGEAVAVVSSELVLVGSPYDNLGTTSAGAAFLISLPPPSLQIQLTAPNTLAVRWPSAAPGYTLQRNTQGVATANWSNLTEGIQDDGTNRTFLTAPSSGSGFFRLLRP